MEPHEKMHHIFHNLLRKLFKAVGHDIFRGPFKPYLLTFCMYGLFASFAVSAVYTIVNYDMLVVLNCIGFLGLASELGMKIYSAKYGYDVVEVMDKIIDIYAANSNSTSRKRLLLLQRFAFITEVVFKGGCCIYYLAGCFYLIAPAYAYFIRNELLPMFPLYFPFIDEKTNTGFAILMGIHIALMIVATAGTAATDFLFITIIVNFPVLSTILKDNIEELSSMLSEEEVNMPLAKAKFKNILLLHRDIYDVIDTLDTPFFKICFVQIASAAVAASLELFICLKIEFFPAIGLTIGYLCQIIGFCGVGTIIEICNEQMYESILSCDWFLLTCSDQKLYGFLMLNAQEAKALTIGGLAPLNMASCVSILKTIYSYLMLLFTFIA